MTVQTFDYQIFDYLLVSNVVLSELPHMLRGKMDEQNSKRIFFQLEQDQLLTSQRPEWFHHWYLPNGEISISCGKNEEAYFLHFPSLADFKIYPDRRYVVCFPITRRAEIIRHLLLDQVIPRVLYHCGEFVIHASGVVFANGGALFLGASHFGKSTIAMSLNCIGYPHSSDDCVLLRQQKDKIIIVPNYSGVRLWPSSVTALLPKRHVGSSRKKIRMDFGCKNGTSVVDPLNFLANLFFLNDPSQEEDFSIRPITGAAKAIELIKHCFPLDISNEKIHKNQFAKLSMITKNSDVQFNFLSFRRNYSELAMICERIASHCQAKCLVVRA